MTKTTTKSGIQFINTRATKETLTAEIDKPYHAELFTEAEHSAFQESIISGREGGYKEIQYTSYMRYTTIEISRDYIESRFGLKDLLKIMDKLSGPQGVRSKPLYAYYEKVFQSRLKGPIAALYEDVKGYDISDLNHRFSYRSDIIIRYGKESYNGLGGVKTCLMFISKQHLRRCLAILIEHGYVVPETKQIRGRRSVYGRTTYQLTDKATQLLNNTNQGGRN